MRPTHLRTKGNAPVVRISSQGKVQELEGKAKSSEKDVIKRGEVFSCGRTDYGIWVWGRFG